MKVVITQSSPASCHFLPFKSKYSPQQPSQTSSIYAVDKASLYKLRSDEGCIGNALNLFMGRA